MKKIPTGESMPHGVVNAYWFQVFNATSWSIILGTPMLLYLKNLGASVTVLGIAVALIPLFSAFQIPAASIAERVGYKTFVVRGWASRSIFILGIALAALWPETLTPTWRIALVLAMLVCFALVRGLSMCGYLPWITGIVPTSLRGTFLARDTMCMYLAVTATMLLSSFWVGRFPNGRSFGVVFLFSYLAALSAIFFLRRIPDIPGAAQHASSTHPPWMEMILYPPFIRYVRFTVVFNLSASALNVIWVPFMRDNYQASGSLILGLSAYSSIIAALTSRLTGAVADRVGSRPLIGLAIGWVMVGQCLWMAMAAGVLPRHVPILFGITSFGAVGFAVQGLASTRLLMGLVPVTGRSHFFAIANVANSLTLGLMPIAWGLIFDSMGRLLPDRAMPLSVWSWNRYSLIYAVIVAGLLAAQYFRRQLDEPKAMSTEHFIRMLFLHAPARLLARVTQPLRRFFPPG